MTVHTRDRAPDESHTYEDLIQLWQDPDAYVGLARSHGRRRSRTPRIVVVGWYGFVAFLLSSLVWLPMALRAVGHALD
jgi:hypothetical protein